MKKLFSLLLTLILLLGLVPSVSANSTDALQAAQGLYELGLFRGTGTNPDSTPIFDLDKAPTRNQAVIMLVRLLGKEEEALAGEWEIPFIDAAKESVAYPYIGYAYAHGLTKGTTATTFSGDSPIRPNQYITFVLRAMGYASGEDFEAATAWTLSDELGITGGVYTAATQRFTRGDIASITLSALTCPIKESKKTLFSTLREHGGLAQDIRYAEPHELEYAHYCNDWGEPVGYAENYLQNLTVAKTGSLYQFKIALKPGCFSRAYLFPAGYQNEDDDGKYSKTINLFANPLTDDGSIFVNEDFIFNNPICQTDMILKLVPILTAFPDDFQFAEGCRDDCILIKISTNYLPR